jgi:hypothetical protein
MRAPRALRRKWIAKTQQKNRNEAECALPSQPLRTIRELQTPDQRYEEAFQHCCDCCCTRVRRARFGTAYESGSDCEHRYRPGCPSSRWVRSLFSAPQSERGACWFARCGPPILNVWLYSGCSESWPCSTKPAATRPAANSCCAPPRPQTRSFAPWSPNGVRSALAGGLRNDRRP